MTEGYRPDDGHQPTSAADRTPPAVGGSSASNARPRHLPNQGTPGGESVAEPGEQLPAPARQRRVRLTDSVPTAEGRRVPGLPRQRRGLIGLVAAVLTVGALIVGSAVTGSSPTAPSPAQQAAAPGELTPTDQPVPTGSDSAVGTVGYVAGAPFLSAAPGGGAGCNNSIGQAPTSRITGGRYGRVVLGDAQVLTAATVISVGKALKISDRGIRVALLVAMTESSLDPFKKKGDLQGLFQQPSKGGYQRFDRLDAIGAARMFYADLKKKSPSYAKDIRPDWALAELVQGKKIGLKYNGWRTTAITLVGKLYPKTPAYDFTRKPDLCPQDGETATGVPTTFDPGMIISDEVFYNSKAMSLKQIRAFIKAQGAQCSGQWCLKNLRLTVPSVPADKYCMAIPGGTDDAAEVLWKVSLACRVNPQVMLVTLQKESGLLSETEVSQADYAAAFGWHCPDTGPGGTANCDPQYAGFFKQAAGMAKQWARYVVDPDKYHYHAGQTATVLYNVQESGCGGSEVTIRNKATASLYNYTPYQPNAAALASYPGVGDACSTYGNRNFYFLFSRYFGTIGGSAVSVSGVDVTIPRNSFVPEGLAGKTIKAPNAAVAKGLAAGFGVLGTPYVWGGGTDNGGPDEGCSRGGGALNSCQGLVGLDCSGLTGYVMAQAGYRIPTNSAAQRGAGTDVRWPDAQPGDIIGYDGHVAIYLGIFDGTAYMLEAPDVGKHVRIRDVMSGADPVVHRFWA